MKNRYRTLPIATCLRLVSEFLQGGARPLGEPDMAPTGSGPELDLGELAAVAERIEQDRKTFAASSEAGDRDLFEGRASGLLHHALRDVPVQILDDPGFWRYITLGHFWPLTYWREQQTFDAGDPGKYSKYVDGYRTTECVVSRMYLRAQAVNEDGDYALAGSIPKGADFWRSHVLRVSVGAVPVVAREFARQQAQDRMTTTELRPYARRLNRMATNVVLPLLDGSDASTLLGELREA
jgi:hypothetical protein